MQRRRLAAWMVDILQVFRDTLRCQGVDVLPCRVNILSSNSIYRVGVNIQANILVTSQSSCRDAKKELQSSLAMIVR